MALYELTSEGPVIATLDEVIESINSNLKAQFGAVFDTSDSSVAGVLIKSIAEVANELAGLGLAVYNSFDPDTAVGQQLDRACNRIGVYRQGALPSKVDVEVTGDYGTIIPSNYTVTVDGTKERFLATDTTTLNLTSIYKVTLDITSLIPANDYVVTINSINYTYMSDASPTEAEIVDGLASLITAGTEPVTASNISDSLVLIGDDPATPYAVSVSAGITPSIVSKIISFQSEDNGPIAAPAGTITGIATPVGGESVVNLEDAELGRLDETDTALRIRRRESVALAGASTEPALKAALLALEGVTAVLIVSNRTDAVDGAGRPPHSFETIVLGGSEADILATIWEDHPIGIQSYGSISANYTDPEGESRVISYSRFSEVYVHVRVTYSINPEENFPTSTGESAMLSAVLSTGINLTGGQDVVPGRFWGPLYQSVAGLGDILVELAVSAGPLDPPGAYQSTTLVIQDDEISVFDSARVTFVQV